MPHQCVRCNTFYEDGADEILKGCPCGARLFFFVKQSKLEKAREMTKQLTTEDRTQIEEDVFNIIETPPDDQSPVILDLESVNIVEPGKFELDLVSLFNKKKPLIYKLEEGKYVIDLGETFFRSQD